MAEPRRQAPSGWGGAVGSVPGSTWSADSGPVPLVPQRRAPDLSGMPPSRREPLQPPASAVQPARSPSPLGRRPGPPSRSFAPASSPPPPATAGSSHPVAGSSAALDAVLAVMGREQEAETNFLYAAQPRAAFPRAPSPLDLDPGSPGAGASRTGSGGASAAGLDEVLPQTSSWSQQPAAAASRVAAPSYGSQGAPRSGGAPSLGVQNSALDALLKEVPRPISPLNRRPASPLQAASRLQGDGGSSVPGKTLLGTVVGPAGGRPAQPSPAASQRHSPAGVVSADAASLSSAAASMLQRIQSTRVQAGQEESASYKDFEQPKQAPPPPPQVQKAWQQPQVIPAAPPAAAAPVMPPPNRATSWATTGMAAAPPVQQPASRPLPGRQMPMGGGTLTSPQSDALYPAPPAPPTPAVPPSMNTSLRAPQRGRGQMITSTGLSQGGDAAPVPAVPLSNTRDAPYSMPSATSMSRSVQPVAAPMVNRMPQGRGQSNPFVRDEFAPPPVVVPAPRASAPDRAQQRGFDTRQSSAIPGSPTSPSTDLVASIRGAQTAAAASSACTTLVEYLDSKRAASDDAAIRIAAAGAAPAAVGVITSFGRSSPSACAAALAVLRVALRPGSAPQAAACAGGAPAAVVSCLQWWPQDQAVTREGCAALRVLAVGASAAAMRALANAGGIEALVGLLRTIGRTAGGGPPTEPSRTVAACEALWHLCGHAACVQTAISAGILPSLTLLLRSAAAHAASGAQVANVAAAACGLLQRLSTQPVAQADAHEAGTVAAVVDALFAFESHSGVQAAGCAALWVLTSGHNLNAQKAGDAGAVEAAVRAITVHAQAPALQGAACGALRALSIGCVENQARSVSAGAFEAVVGAIRKNGANHAGLAESAAAAIGAMCGISLTAQSEASRVGAASAIVELMNSHVKAASVQAAAAFALATMAEEGPNTRAEIAGCGGLEALVRTLDTHRSSARAQEAACAALAVLMAGSPERCLRAGAANAVDSLCRTAFASGSSAQVQTAVFGALAAACAPGDGSLDNATRAHSGGAIEAASTAIRLHPKDGLVCVGACGLITLLLHALGSIATRSVNESGVAQLIAAMTDAFAANEEVMIAVRSLQAALAISDDTYARVMRQRAPEAEEIPEALERMWDFLSILDPQRK